MIVQIVLIKNHIAATENGSLCMQTKADRVFGTRICDSGVAELS